MSIPDSSNVAVGVVNNMTKYMVLPFNKESLLENLKDFTPTYYMQDDFTVAVLDKGNGKRYVGVSKRNASDHKNPIRGKSLALARAYKSAVRDFLSHND